MAITGREIVLETLLLITRDGEYSHIALRNVLDKYQYLEKKERAFISRVVNGTLERMIELDYIIDQFSSVKVRKMKPVIQTILRSSVYQMKYMDSVPDAAVCNEAVKLAVKKGFLPLKGFVNGVLRNISRNLEEIRFPDKADMCRYISIRFSLPEWLVKQWLSVYDAETVILMGVEFLKEKPLSIRCNRSKLTPEQLKKKLLEEGVTVTDSCYFSYAFYIAGYDHLGGLESFRNGYFYVQDISSMFVSEWAGITGGEYVIDVCAAPGGKALHIAELLDGTGHVEARDLTEYKVELIGDNIRKSGLSNISALRQDALDPAPSSFEKADVVIADLPCSGLGVLGRKPDIKYRMTEEEQRALRNLQRRILSVVNQYVKPGGRLIYSTCTIHRGENEENAVWFSREYPEFKIMREKQLLPGREKCDGFYIAEFQKEK